MEYVCWPSICTESSNGNQDALDDYRRQPKFKLRSPGTSRGQSISDFIGHGPQYHRVNLSTDFPSAGSETTTAALSATPYYLMQSPEAKDNVIQEVRNRFSGVDETNAIGIDQLKYLPTCFSEAVRKFPPAPSVFSGRVSKLGANITGKLMPEARRWHEDDDCHAMQGIQYRASELPGTEPCKIGDTSYYFVSYRSLTGSSWLAL
ncbi:hypothetical protein ETB97_002426 [Aspergillus alliaceus]|uniref:Uncharacterized protein n=1 Tax=Petromyces alliaceus TaxID=209559 RepID=A0A8H6A2H4_PETAA|nr:hypothetical protein ETB97_002426 [Aspergillus burnettii]